MSYIKHLFMILGLALVQVLFFMALIFLFERLDLIWLRVTYYNSDLFTPGELAMLFFLILLENELIAYVIRHAMPQRFSFFTMAVLISIMQFLILWGMLDLLSMTHVITFTLTTAWAIPPTVLFIVYFFSLILICELAIEYMIKPEKK